MKHLIIIGLMFLGSHLSLNAMTQPNDPYSKQPLEKVEKLIDIPFEQSNPAQFTQQFSVYTESCAYYSISSTKGRRPYMEDTNNTEYFDYDRSTHGVFFGLFDGHGPNNKVALNLSQCLFHQYISVNIQALQPLDLAIRDGFIKANKDIMHNPQIDERNGSTALCAFLLKGGRLVIANAGDSCAILGRIDYATNNSYCYCPMQLSIDHRLDANDDEKERIKKQGGIIVQDAYGTYRINGLAVSRSFGHTSISQYVMPNPDIFTFDLTPEDQLLILASDGLWDVLSNQEVVDLAMPLMHTPTEASETLIKTALTNGSQDNITVIVINLSKYWQ